MNVLTLLKQDHRYLEELFGRIEASTDRGELAFLRDKVIDELTLHTTVEEDVFYPAVRDASGREVNDLVLQSYEEHHAVELLMSELDGIRPTDIRFRPKLAVLIKIVRQHISEEEEELFPKVSELMSDERLDILGDAVDRAQRIGSDRRGSGRGRSRSSRARSSATESASEIICCALCPSGR